MLLCVTTRNITRDTQNITWKIVYSPKIIFLGEIF